MINSDPVIQDEKLYYSNGVYLGDLVLNNDGFIVFFPNPDSCGYWDEGFLTYVLEVLEARNAPWRDTINQLFSK